jgi:glycosyltransferase involved in cell wall biosynthesis
MSEHRFLHVNADFKGSLRLVFAMAAEVLVNLPRIWRLRKIYRKRLRPSEPTVVLMGDNMDATHGISVSTERMVHDLRKRGKNAYMLGISHSLREPGIRSPDGAVLMVRPSVVQDLFGYPGQELSFPDVAEICGLLERVPVDVVELESPGIFGLLMVVLAPILGIALVQNYRTDMINYYRVLLGKNPLFVGFLEWYTHSFLKCGDRVVVPSQAFREDVLGFGLARSKVEQLPRSVELGHFNPEHADRQAWTERGAPAAGPIVLFLGRVSREKGLETLISAWPEILKARPDAVLGVVGDGPFRQEFETCMASLGPAVFTGMVVGDELPRLVAACAVLAFPSTTDTFGNAVLEALASGVPAVVTDQGGPCEIVRDGRSGLVVPGDDAPALARAVTRLLADPDLHEQMATAARIRAEDFSPEQAIARQWEFFRDVQDRRRKRS